MSSNNYAERWRTLLDTNTTDTSFDSMVVTATKPASDDTVICNGRSTLELIPFGAGSDNNTMKGRVIGWARTMHDANKVLWIPDVLCEFTGTLSTSVGVATYKPVNTDRLCDTITITDGIGAAPAGGNNVAVKLTVDVSNYELVGVILHNNSSATNANALYRLV